MSASAANPPSPAAPGSGRAWAVPGYTEVRPLGGGGFGEVVLATHGASGTAVAIKYLHPDLLRDPEHVSAFRAEARTLASLDNPHVVRLYEYVAGPEGAAIVMELVEGVTLAKLLERQGKTTPEAALVVLYGSLLGLAAAHAKGVVHRDYKPANVLIDGQGVSKLTDFGIAALAGDRPVPTGTLCYMPPEQFEGAAASPAADVYAATVTFYQCLAGRVPFDGRTADELYGKHKSAPVPMDDIPEPLRPVIGRGMAKDPRSRPSDAGGLAAELRDAATDSYGEAWEDRGRSHLAEAALLLLALLWPSGGSSSVAGSAVEEVQLNDPNRAAPTPHPAQSAETTHGAHAAQAGQTAGSSGQADETHAEHLHHVEHVEHEEHIKHLEHVEHEEHLAHLRAEGGGNSGQSARRGSRPRTRLHLAVAGGAAVVIAAVAGAAIALSSHNSSGSSSGSPSAAAHADTGAAATNTAGGAGGTATAPTFTASFSMTRHIISCVGGCITGPLPLTIVCHSNGSCTATSSHWNSAKQGTINGSTLSFSGIDTGVSGCDQPSQVTLNLTVTSWSAGNAATRQPLALSGPYTVVGPATSGCSAWDLNATLTSS